MGKDTITHANELLESGASAESLAIISRILRASPDNPAALQVQAKGQSRLGQIDAALETLRRLVAVEPRNVAALFDLGAFLHEQGRSAEAESVYRQILSLEPYHVGALTNIGAMLTDQERFEEADNILTPALSWPSRSSAILTYLMNARLGLGRMDLAEEAAKALVTIAPAQSAAWTILAGAARKSGRLEEALNGFRKALATNPLSAEAHKDLGVAYLDLGRTGEGIEALKTAVAIAPDNPEALLNLGNALEMSNTALDPNITLSAIELYKKALDIAPKSIGILFNLANSYKRIARLEEARECCRKIEEINGIGGISVRKLLIGPRVYPSIAAMSSYRQQLIDGLDKLQTEGVTIEDPVTEVGEIGFGLAYHNMNDVEIQSRIARFYLASVPNLDWTAPHCRKYGPRAKGQKLRVGMISSYLHNRTMDNLNERFLRDLSREKFEVVLFRPGGVADEKSESIDRYADKVCRLVNHLDTARRTVASEECDVLFFFEIGMVTLTYFLAFARLAPVQCVTWGHPDTTGIPNMDFFLSSRLLEPANAQEHYSERLVMLSYPPAAITLRTTGGVSSARDWIGVPSGARIYACPQNLMKFHPDFDSALAQILRQDPMGYVVITTSAIDAWRPALLDRISKAFPDVAERIVFLPQMAHEKFMSLLDAADVVIDPFYFSGGNSTHEALALGAPVVTWPGPYMRGRVSLGLYKKMGFEELICADPDEYVRTAIRVANDKEWRSNLKETIRTKSVILFDDPTIVRELEDFFIAATGAAARGEKLRSWPAEN